MRTYTGPTITQILNSYDPMRQVYRLLEQERFDLVLKRVSKPKPTITTVCYKPAFSHPERYKALTITSHERVEVWGDSVHICGVSVEESEELPGLDDFKAKGWEGRL